MKRVISLFVIMFALAANANTITSTSAGGRWTNPATWIGGLPGTSSDVVIDGPVYLDAAVTCHDFTVNAGAMFVNDGGIPDLVVTGSLVNSGTVRDKPGDGYIDIYVAGDFTNYGVITAHYVTLNGSAIQHLSAGQLIQVPEIAFNGTVDPVASTDLSFDTMVSFSLGGRWLNMGTHRLTVRSGIGRGFNSGGVRSDGIIDVRGPFNCNLGGDFTISGGGRMRIGGILVTGNMRIAAGTIVENDGGIPDVTIQGDLLLDGVLRDDPAGGYIDLYLQGNLVLNGSITNGYITFSGTGPQTVTATHSIGVKSWYDKSPNGRIIAGSDLVIDSTCDVALGGDTLVMGTHTLTMRANDAHLIHGTLVMSDGQIDVRGPFAASLDGHPTIIGPGPLSVGPMTVYHDLIIAAGAIVQNNGGVPDVMIQGSLENHGTIRNYPGGGYIDLYLYGNLVNTGVMSQSFTTFMTEGKMLDVTGRLGGTVAVSGNGAEQPGGLRVIQNLTIESSLGFGNSAVLDVPTGAVLDCFGTLGVGAAILHGAITMHIATKFGGTYDFFRGQLQIPDATGMDSLIIRADGEAPSDFWSAIPCTWTMTPVGTPPGMSNWITFAWTHGTLAGNNESQLGVYHSPGFGWPWTSAAPEADTHRDTAGNVLYVHTLPYSGRYVLATGTTAVEDAAVPDQIRFGVFPNPSVNNISVEFTSGSAGRVDISVYDMNGDLIRTLNIARAEAGAHTVPIDARELAAGTYVAVVRTGGTVQRKTFTVVR